VPPIAAKQRHVLTTRKGIGALTEQVEDLLLCLRQSLNIARIRLTLRLAYYRQSVCLRAKLLETHDQHFFTEPLRP
jgi:hypothetical protein